MAAHSPHIAFVESFNHNLKLITRDLSKRFPNDAKVHRAQKRIMTVINIYPLYVIESVGPYLYSYREQIYNLDANGNLVFFLDKNYAEELNEVADDEKIDMITFIMPKVKSIARTLAAEEQAQYKDIVVAMLDDYVEYLAARALK
jgi:hypothetical protein